MEAYSGSTPDISPLLQFYWWQPVYYKLDDSDLPLNTREGSSCFVGITEHVDHSLTYKVLTDKTNKIIHCSAIRSADQTGKMSSQLDPFNGEVVFNYNESSNAIIKSMRNKIILKVIKRQ